MSSSDDEWAINSKPPAINRGNGGAGDMLAMRSRALQQQREARHGTDKSSVASPRRGVSASQSPAPLGPGESAFPADLLGGFSDESEQRYSQTGSGVNNSSKASTAPSAPTRRTKVSSDTTESDDIRRAAPTPAALLEESVASLRQKVNAKKKMLQSLKEKEMALLEKYRSEKAHKKCEISQVEAQLRSMWGMLEDAKRSSDTKLREAGDEYEKNLLASRRAVEAEVKQAFEPKIKEAQEKLDALKTEEQQLKDLLQLENGTRDLVESAVAAATNAIIERLHKLFEANASETAEWNKEVERLVQHEVRTSFAVSAGSEAQSEREEMKKQFHEMLQLWRKVEDEERERILKMDDALLADIQRMAQEDLARLQSEEVTLEEVYIKSREAWADQHQKLLEAEQQSALRRREAEFSEQRALRDQLHAERMNSIEARHEQEMKLEETRHQKELQLLREHFDREQQLKEDQQRVLLATQQEMKNATQSFEGVLRSVEEIVTSLKEFQAVMDQSRSALEDDRLKMLHEREASLQNIQELITNQRVSVEGQHKQLASTIAEISSLGALVTDHLHEEESWLAQQEAKCSAARGEWSREYARWKQLVEQERAATAEQFSGAMSGLQDCLGLLQAEEKQISVEMNAMKEAFADVATSTEKEVSSLATREHELEERHAHIKAVLLTLERKGEETAEQYRILQQERQQLATERNRVRQEISRMRDMGVALQLMKSQTDGIQASTAAATEQCNILRGELRRSKRAEKTTREGPRTSGEKAPRSPRPRHDAAHQRSSTNRLPHKVLTELQQQLANSYAAAPVHPGQTARTPTSTPSSLHADIAYKQKFADPEDLSGRKQQPRPPSPNGTQSPTQISSDPNSSHTFTTFTNLITISDNSHNSG
eukprot:gene5349-3847_t